MRQKVNAIVSISLLHFLLVLTLSFLPYQSVISQSRNQLEKKRKETLEQIKETEHILAETEKNKRVSVGQLHAINKQIQSRQTIIRSISTELKLISKEVEDINILVRAMERDLLQLKKEYAAMIYATYKSKRSYNQLAFLFSAKSFNQFFRRLRYLDQYKELRKIQVKQIAEVKESLEKKKLTLEERKKERERLLQQQLEQSNSLLVLKNKQKEVVDELSKKEDTLLRELAERRKAAEKLRKLLAASIKKRTSSKALPSTPDIKLSNSFKESKSKLLWPVSSGFISLGFGRQPHPVLGKGITIQNDGVDIQTNSGEKVRAVFHGIVKAVFRVPGAGSSILIQHGDYFTVYSKLSNVLVKTGQKIKAKDLIGEVGADSDGTSTFQFQIWHREKTLNPEVWLYKK